MFLSGRIEEYSANLIVAQLLLLDSLDKEKPIQLYVNSPGGSVTATMAILDTMNLVEAPVHTVCVGLAASGGAVVLSAGEKGHRSALKNAEIMIHQPLSGIEGQVTDIKIAAENMQKTKRRINKIMAENTKNTLEKVEKDCEKRFLYEFGGSKKIRCNRQNP